MDLNNLEKSDRVSKGYRTFGLLTFCGALGVLVFSIIYTTTRLDAAVEDIKSNIFVIDKNDNIYQAVSEKRSDTDIRKMQYELQLWLWMKYWWQYDINTYKDNIDKGYAISGKCGDELYAEFERKKVYEDMLNRNKHYKLYLNEVVVLPGSNPIEGYVKGTRVAYTPVGEIRRNFEAIVTLSEGEISPENRLGVIVETFMLQDYSVLETINYDR